MTPQNKHKKEESSFEEWLDITIEETYDKGYSEGFKEGKRTALDAVKSVSLKVIDRPIMKPEVIEFYESAKDTITFDFLPNSLEAWKKCALDLYKQGLEEGRINGLKEAKEIIEKNYLEIHPQDEVL